MKVPGSGNAVRLAVVGATGRMGRAVVRLAHEAKIEVVAAVGLDSGRDAGELAGVGTIGVAVRSLAEAAEAISRSGANVVIDFSTPDVLASACSLARSPDVALVSGTTGLSDLAKAALDEASKRCPVLWEPNMSVGVHVLASLLASAIDLLGPSYDIEIVEAHHRAKVDAPSGTARRLLEVARAKRGGEEVFGRHGMPGPRSAKEIAVHAIRGGDVVGDHTVHLLGEGERLELTHRASNRDLFARGALRAAQWIVGRAPGRYTLADVLAPPT